MITPDQLLQHGGASASTVDEPLEHLQACHRRIEEKLATLERAIPFLSSRRAEALQAITNAIRFLDSSGARHTEDEEQSLFPRLRPKASPDELGFFQHLHADHEKAESIFAELKSVAASLERQPAEQARSAQQFADLVQRLCATYRQHIREEDSTLIEIARRLLSTPELRDIASEMKQRRNLA